MSVADKLPSTEGLAGPSEAAVSYAKLNALYGALLTAMLVTTRDRFREDPIRGPELVPLSAATFALAKLIAKEKVGAWVREPLVDEQQDGRPPRGRGVAGALGELVTCTRCVGAWSALGLVSLRVAAPSAGKTVAAILTASAANDFMQAGFRLLTSQCEILERRS